MLAWKCGGLERKWPSLKNYPGITLEKTMETPVISDIRKAVLQSGCTAIRFPTFFAATQNQITRAHM
jgi:hypothetical protein